MELKTIDCNMRSDSAVKNGIVYYTAEKAPIKPHGFSVRKQETPSSGFRSQWHRRKE